MELEQTSTLLAKPSTVQAIQREVNPRCGCFPSGRASVPLRAMRRASLAILVVHLALLVVNTFSWSQLAACAICVVVCTTVLLCMFSKRTLAVTGVFYALACVLDFGQLVRWIRMAFIVHQNNLVRHPADQVSVVVLSFVIVPAAVGACCCAYGAVCAFDAVGSWDDPRQTRQPQDHSGGLAMLPLFEGRAGL